MHRWVRTWTYRNCIHITRHVRKDSIGPVALLSRCAYSVDVRSAPVPSRYHELSEARTEVYPRLSSTASTISCREFVRQYRDWTDTSLVEPSNRTVHGRISNIRSASSKLVFVDVVADDAKVQGVCNLSDLKDTSKDQLKAHFQELQRGDFIKLNGAFYKTSSGEPSLKLDKLPELLTPCLHPLPASVRDQETIVGKRHVGFLANEKAARFIRAKSKIVQAIRQFLLDDEHIEVQTPILADAAGGAIARPFHTIATEFEQRDIALRIAPELWLKRMVVGGFDRVFEIGPSFRNEGIDSTHNPEFTTCEFYRTYTDLEGLMKMTEQMLEKARRSINSITSLGLEQGAERFCGPYKRIDFITGLENAIGAELPDLSRSTAGADLKEMVKKLSLPLDTTNVVNRCQLLDKLAGEYLEPLCGTPTFITGHPECMSPLAKSYVHPTRPNQRIAARAELFVGGSEIANMYEEENSPIEQRRKFVEQSAMKGDSEGELDEAYLEALEWGLPPVGGWGCGIERLTMAMTGSTRISDVLSFGTLRNVVSKHSRK